MNLLAKKCPVSLVDSTTMVGLPSARSISVVAGVLAYSGRAAVAEMPTTPERSRYFKLLGMSNTWAQTADSLEQQLPIDAVKEAFDVEIKHPIVAPAALTSCAYGIKRRSAGPVTIN